MYIDVAMGEPTSQLREENQRLLTQLSLSQQEVCGLRASLARLQKEHESAVIRLSTEILALKRQLFGPKAERIRNADAQQSLLDVLVDIGRLKAGDLLAGARADAVLGELREEAASPSSEEQTMARPPEEKRKKRKAKPHGRQNLDESKLPVEKIVIEPLERKLEGGDALVRIGEEVSSHLDYRPSSVIRVEVTRPKYLRPEQAGTCAVLFFTLFREPPAVADPIGPPVARRSGWLTVER